MTDAFWSDVAALFDEATHVSGAVRSEWLDRRCHDRPDVRREVESLLRAHDASGDFLATSTDADATTDPAARFVGRSFGGFRIIEPIGHGGMSVVYRAERAGEFSQDVAVKLIDATARNADAMRRFRTERQVMADLRHPHIVALLDLHRVDFARALTALAWSNRANHAEDVACRQLRRSVAVMGPAFDNGAPEPETDGGIRTSNASGLRSCPPAR